MLAAGLPAAASPSVTSSPPPAVAATKPAAASEPLTAPDAVTASTIAALMDAPVEVLGERTETGSVFALPDGTMAAGQAAGPVWVRSGGDGTAVEDWVPVDLTLVADEDGLVRPVAHGGDLAFAGGATAEPAGAGPAVQPNPQSQLGPAGSPTPDSDGAPRTEPRAATAPSSSAADEPVEGSEASPPPAQEAVEEPAVAAPTAPSTPEGAVVAPSNEPRVDLAVVSDPSSGVTSRIQWEGALPAPVLAGRRATYREVRPGIDLVLEATSTGFEQFFVVHERPSSAEPLDLPLTVVTEGAELTTGQDGRLDVVLDGEVVASAPAPLMWDAAADRERPFPVTGERPEETVDAPRLAPMPAWVLDDERGRGTSEGDGAERANPEEGAVAPAIVGDGSGDPVSDTVVVDTAVDSPGASEAELRLQPQAEFLQDPTTEYPVVVDPELSFAWGFDTYVLKGYSNDRSAATELVLGTYDGGAHIGRPLITFPTSAIMGAQIINAQLSMYNHYSWSCQARNWQVWSTSPASTASTWNNQPAWYQTWAMTSLTRGYSAACGEGWSYVDITNLAGVWASTNMAEGYVGLTAQHETDNLSYKKFLSANYGSFVPTVWVSYNKTPNLPTGPHISNSPTGSSSGSWVNTLTPTISATLSDPDGGTVDGHFWVQRGDDAQGVFSGAVTVPSGTVGSVRVESGRLKEGQTYAFGVKAADCCVYGPSAPFFWFGVDTTRPLAPTVTSSDYPSNSTWNKGPGQAGSFTFSMPSSDPSVTGYQWALDGAPDPNQVKAVTAGAPVTFQLTPATAGRHVLQVQAVDRAGNVSAGITKYVFHVGSAGILLPEDGAQVVRRVRLAVGSAPGLNEVKFQWRYGPGTPENAAPSIPVGHLYTSTNQPWPTEWQPRPEGTDGTGYTAWDAGSTLGFAGGPVQVRALVRSSTAPSVEHATQWVTLTVRPDATGAASTSIGPGSVNLLTGDHVLSATDVEEFGLSLMRTSSSRDTDAGYELQKDRLSVEAQNASTPAIFAPANLLLSTSTTVQHSGGSSLRTAPTTNDPTGNNYFILNEGTPALPGRLIAGRSYRVSGWVYVEVPQGSSVPAGGHWAAGTIRLFNKLGTDPTWVQAPGGTSRPTIANAWRQVTFDVTIPTNASSSFFIFTNGFTSAGQAVYWDDLSVRELWSPFGPEWSSGTFDASAGTAYTRITRPYDDVASVELTGGGEVWFTSADSTHWWPEPGGEGLTLTLTSPTTWRLREVDGTVTDFARNEATKDFPVTTTSPPGAVGVARHMYDTQTVAGVSRLSRIIAPIEPGVDGWPDNSAACTTTPYKAGCEVLEINYATTTTATSTQPGSFVGRVASVDAWSWDGSAVSKKTVASYSYDTSGRLVSVHDPRVAEASSGTVQATTYAYDTAGRVTQARAPGEPAYTFTYGAAGPAKTTGSGDLIDGSAGRLLRVSLPWLEPGTTSTWGAGTNSTNVVYNVPLTKAKGGPYDLDASALSTWAQQDGPTDATAIFGPQFNPGTNNATSTTPGTAGYAPATVHYLNASGQEVNTASPAGPSAPAQGFIDTTEYDNRGNAIRTLDATNRLLAFSEAGTTSKLSGWGLDNRTSAELAQMLDTRNTYSADGLDLLTSTGPAQRLAVANNPADVRTLRAVTTNVYDQGKPDAADYHLVTTTTTAGKEITPGGQTVDPVTTTYGYTPIDGLAATGLSSGWIHKQATSVTVNPGTAFEARSTVVYDDRARPIRSSKPGSNGSDAATTISAFYTAGPSGDGCGDRPQWAGQPCLTKAFGAVTGHDPTRMATELPIKRVTGYNRWGSPTVVTETATGPVAGSQATLSRTTTTTYDAADRVQDVTISGTGAGVGAAIQTTRTLYDQNTGDVTSTQSVVGTTVTATVSKEYDALGRLVSYTDSAGATTTTTYDRYGKPIRSSESIANVPVTTEYEYDSLAEPRGYLTAIKDSVAGRITATWGPDGQLETEQLPGGVTLTIGYDPTRVPVTRTYTRTSDGQHIWRDSVVENHRGQWIQHTADTGTRSYAYDGLGRLTTVTDVVAKSTQCTVRAYGFAGSPRSNRTQFATATNAAVGTDPAVCPTVTLGAATATYDSADRLLTSNGNATWTYDPLGRITSMPSPDGPVTNAFFVNDLIQQQTRPGASRTTWTLDPLGRRSMNTIEVSAETGFVESAKKASHYANDSDEPSWIAEQINLPSDVTRYVSGVEGDIALTTSLTGDRELQLVDLHGDVVGTLPVADGATEAAWLALRLLRSDEFGNPTPLTGSGSTTGPPARYGWLGAAQRSAEALGGVILMGVRLYSPSVGRFLSIDPVPGGSANAYDYCNADPVNCTDLGGTFSFKSLLSAVAIVGEIASFIPGPVGAAAAGISAVAYAAQGNTAKAIEMGVTAAAQLVGAGAVVRVAARAVNVARAAGQAAVRAAPRIQRAALSVASAVRRVATTCSFLPGTLVVMADHSLMPIETLHQGDLLLTTDPSTGESSTDPVLAPLTSSGTKHLFEIKLSDTSWIATHNHPFWVDGAGWVAASELSPGARLQSASGGAVIVEAIHDLGWRSDQTVFNLHVANSHAYYVSDQSGATTALVHNAQACSIGGVYALVSDSGTVVRTGRTNNLTRRATEHARTYGNLRFVTLHRTNSRAVQRGLEAMADARYSPILNRVRPISRYNPRRSHYMNAARDFLRQ